MKSRVKFWTAIAATGVAGIAAGFGLSIATLPTPSRTTMLDLGPLPSPTASATPDPYLAKLAEGPASKLGAELMARVGRRFVGRYIPGGELAYGVFFYDLPKPYGESLCRVNVYSIPAKIIRKTGPKSDETFDDDLEVTTRYAIWGSPSAPDKSDGARERACSAYRDFDHTFAADKDGPGRAPILFDILLRIANGEGRAPFPVECIVFDGPLREKHKPCDARTVLRQWSLKMLMQVRNESTSEEKDGKSYRDTLFISAPSPKDEFAISIESVAPWVYRTPRPTDIRRVVIDLGKNCVC